MYYLLSNQILRSPKHFFLKGRSCLTNLPSFLELAIASALDAEFCVALLLKISHAFDSVPHERLLKKICSALLS